MFLKVDVKLKTKHGTTPPPPKKKKKSQTFPTIIDHDNRGNIKSIWAASWESQQSAYAKPKAQISFAVTAKLISAFVFATQIVQSLFFLNPKFQVYSLLLWLYSLICVGPVHKTTLLVSSWRGLFVIAVSESWWSSVWQEHWSKRGFWLQRGEYSFKQGPIVQN